MSPTAGVPTTAAEYDATLDTYAYDPEAAKALLVEAGFDFNETIKLRYYAGRHRVHQPDGSHRLQLGRKSA